MPLQHRPIRPSRVLHPTVAMMNEPAWRAAALESHDQGVDTQASLEVLRHGPADDLARGQILDGRQVQKALIGWNVRDVGCRSPIQMSPLSPIEMSLVMD